MNSGGFDNVDGNAMGVTHGNTGEYVVFFDRQLDDCVSTATLATVLGGVTGQPPPGRITVAHSANSVTVRTYDAGGSLDDIPFNIIVAC